MKKIVVLDFRSQLTYVIPFDEAVYEVCEDCIVAFDEEHDLGISLGDIQWMVVDNFKLVKVLKEGVDILFDFPIASSKKKNF